MSVPVDVRVGAAAPVSRRVGVVLVVGLAAALRFSELGARGFWRDEAVTVQLARRSFGGMLEAIPHSEGTPPLYYVLAWLWTRLFGSSEAGIRSLSALAGTIAVLVVYAIGVELVSHRVALAAALLAAVNPLLVWHSQDARSYGLFTLLGALSFLAFLRALANPGTAELVAWTLASALALGTHYFAAFLVVPEAIWLLASRRRRTSVVVAVGAFGLVGAALVPLALAQRSSAEIGWIAQIPRLRRIRELAEQFLVGPQAPAAHTLAALASVCVLGALVVLLTRGSERERRGALLAGAVAAAAMLLALALSLAGIDYFLSRNLIVAWVPLAVTAAAGFAGSRSGAVGAAALAVLVGLSLAVVVSTARKPKFGGEDWRGAARALGTSTDDRAVVLWLGVGADPFVLYRPHARRMSEAGAFVREVDVVSVGADHAGISSKGASLYPPEPFRQAARIDERYFTIVRFRSAHAQHVRPATLVSGGPGYSAAVLLDQR